MKIHQSFHLTFFFFFYFLRALGHFVLTWLTESEEIKRRERERKKPLTCQQNINLLISAFLSSGANSSAPIPITPPSPPPQSHCPECSLMFSAFIINGGKHLISVLEGSASGAAVETEMTLSQPHPVPFYTGCGFEWYISVMQQPLRQTTEQETLLKKNKQTKKTYLTCSNCCFKLVIEVLI